MATITPTITKLFSITSGEAYKIVWSGMANGDVGAAIGYTECADRTLQVEDTFGSGGNLRLEGSNDSSTYYALNDNAGNALNITLASLKSISEATASQRPRVTAGDGTTSLTVTMIVRR